MYASSNPRESDLGPGAAVALATATLALAHLYLRLIELPYVGERMALHADILAGVAESPYRYRVLVPVLTEALRRLLGVLVVDRIAFLLAFVALNIASIGYYLARTFLLLRRWMPQGGALACALLVACVMPVAFQDHAYQPWSFLEAGLFAHACSATLDRRGGAVLALTAVATLNRETGLFVAALWPLTSFSTAPAALRITSALRATLPLLVWASVYGALRIGLGHAAHVRSVAEMFALNVRPRDLLLAAINLLVLLGPLWLLLRRGLRAAPDELRSLLWIVPPYLLFYLVFGRWLEVRVLLTPLPLIVATALWPLFSLDAERR